MTRNKIISVVALLIPALLATTGCYRQQLEEANEHGLVNDPFPKAPKNPASVLRVLMWEDTMSVSVVEDFEKRYGIKLEITTFKDNAGAYAMLKTNPDNWDVIMVSQFMSARMNGEGMLQQIPRRNADVYKYINVSVINKDADPQMKYFVPFDYAALGISFNINYMAGFPKTWGYIDYNAGNPYLYGRILMPDDMRYSIATALLYIGVDPDKATIEDVARAKNVLIANIKKLGIRFVDFASASDELMKNDALVAVTWSGTAGLVLRKKQECRFLVPEGKSIISVDGFSIPAGCKCPETSALLIEYMLHPYVSYQIANGCMYASANVRSMKYVDRFIVNGPSCMLPQPADMIHIKFLSEHEKKYYAEAWAEIKATSIDPDRIRIIPSN